MQNTKKALITAALLLFTIACFFSITTAETLTSQITWITPQTTSIATAITATRCMNYPGNNNITVTVIDYPQNTYDTNATVTATLYKPNGDVNSSIPFTNNADGNYTKTINFDTNGTYTLAIHAVNDTNNNITADTNTYIYVGTFDISISFLNNNTTHTAGEAGSIRNMVKNTDGNAFTGLTGTTTIYYPNATVFAQDATMTGLGTGEYYYNFIIPNTTGTYSATSTFTCGLSTDSNNAGRFTVTGTEIPPVTPGSGGVTGGGGGGGGNIAGYTDLAIIEIAFDKNLAVGQDATLNVTVYNGRATQADFIVSATITQGASVKFFSTETVNDLKSMTARRIVFNEKWLPDIGGTHTVEIKILSVDKKTTFDTKIKTFDVPGELRYDVVASCLNDVLKPGQNINANVMLLNLGNYYQDISLDAWVEGPDGKIIKKETSVIAVYTGESRNIPKSFFIPEGSPYGIYTFVAQIDYRGTKQVSKCGFSVKKDIEYYTDVLNSAESNLNYLAALLEDKRKSGIDVSGIEKELLEIRKNVLDAREKLAVKDLIGMDNAISEIESEIASAEEHLNAVQPGIFMSLPVLILAITAAVSASALVLIYISRMSRKTIEHRLKKLEQKILKHRRKSKKIKKHAHNNKTEKRRK